MTEKKQQKNNLTIWYLTMFKAEGRNRPILSGLDNEPKLDIYSQWLLASV